MHLIDLHFIHFKQLGYLGIYLALALGILGVPVPDEALMTFLGYQIQGGKLNYEITVTVSFLGSLTGMLLSYLIGRGLLSNIEQKLEKKYNITDKRKKFENLFNKYGNTIIVVGYFFPGIRHLTAYSSGLLKMSFPKYLFYASIGAFLWVNIFIVLGFYLGNDWRYLLHLSVHYKNIITSIFLLLVLVLFYFLPRRKKSQSR